MAWQVLAEGAPRALLVAPGARAAAERSLVACAPEEGIGLLAGRVMGRRHDRRTGVAVHFLPLANTAPDRRRLFALAAPDLARALAHVGARGLVPLAVVHSHPGAPPRPSRLDAEGSWAELLTVIVGGPDRPLWRAYASGAAPTGALRAVPLALSRRRGRGAPRGLGTRRVGGVAP